MGKIHTTTGLYWHFFVIFCSNITKKHTCRIVVYTVYIGVIALLDCGIIIFSLWISKNFQHGYCITSANMSLFFLFMMTSFHFLLPILHFKISKTNSICGTWHLHMRNVSDIFSSCNMHAYKRWKVLFHTSRKKNHNNHVS